MEHFLQVFDGGPNLRETKSNCHLYRDKDDSDVYVYVIVIGPHGCLLTKCHLLV